MDKNFFVISLDFEHEGYDNIASTPQEVADTIMSYTDTFNDDSTTDSECEITIVEFNLTDELAERMKNEEDFFMSVEWADDEWPEGVKKYSRSIHLTKKGN